MIPDDYHGKTNCENIKQLPKELLIPLIMENLTYIHCETQVRFNNHLGLNAVKQAVIRKLENPSTYHLNGLIHEDLTIRRSVYRLGHSSGPPCIVDGYPIPYSASGSLDQDDCRVWWENKLKEIGIDSLHLY